MTSCKMNGRVLIVAGSDSGGGAGIQADIKTVTALGGFAMTAITALTSQNTRGVTSIFDVMPYFVAEQMRVTLTDIGADAIKTGMLHRADIIEIVCDVLDDLAPGVPLVVDPVMVAKGGAELLSGAACHGADAEPAGGLDAGQRAGGQSRRHAPRRRGAAGHGAARRADEGRPSAG